MTNEQKICYGMFVAALRQHYFEDPAVKAQYGEDLPNHEINAGDKYMITQAANKNKGKPYLTFEQVQTMQQLREQSFQNYLKKFSEAPVLDSNGNPYPFNISDKDNDKQKHDKLELRLVKMADDYVAGKPVLIGGPEIETGNFTALQVKNPNDLSNAYALYAKLQNAEIPKILSEEFTAKPITMDPANTSAYHIPNTGIPNPQKPTSGRFVNWLSKTFLGHPSKSWTPYESYLKEQKILTQKLSATSMIKKDYAEEKKDLMNAKAISEEDKKRLELYVTKKKALREARENREFWEKQEQKEALEKQKEEEAKNATKIEVAPVKEESPKPELTPKEIQRNKEIAESINNLERSLSLHSPLSSDYKLRQKAENYKNATSQSLNRFSKYATGELDVLKADKEQFKQDLVNVFGIAHSTIINEDVLAIMAKDTATLDTLAEHLMNSPEKFHENVTVNNFGPLKESLNSCYDSSFEKYNIAKEQELYDKRKAQEEARKKREQAIRERKEREARELGEARKKEEQAQKKRDAEKLEQEQKELARRASSISNDFEKSLEALVPHISQDKKKEFMESFNTIKKIGLTQQLPAGYTKEKLQDDLHNIWYGQKLHVFSSTVSNKNKESFNIMLEAVRDPTSRTHINTLNSIGPLAEDIMKDPSKIQDVLFGEEGLKKFEAEVANSRNKYKEKNKEEPNKRLTIPHGKPWGFLLPSLACNRTSFSDFGNTSVNLFE